MSLLNNVFASSKTTTTLSRICLLLSCDKELRAVALIYLERYSTNTNKSPDDPLLTDRGLLATSVLLATKFFCDERTYNNDFFAKIGGVSLREMNCLELKFLKKIDFKLLVSKEEYERSQKEIDDHNLLRTNVAISEGRSEYSSFFPRPHLIKQVYTQWLQHQYRFIPTLSTRASTKLSGARL